MNPDQPTTVHSPLTTHPALAKTQVADTLSPTAPSNAASDEPVIGMRVGEFLLLEELGNGSFGRVFLAGQEGLNRKVALKLTRLRTMSEDEGKALGGLEHDHIVKVYAAFTSPGTEWHCLCLQHVPGADLRAVIERLHGPNGPPRSGRGVLEAVDAVGRKDGAFDPVALRDRDSLAGDDFPQAVCRLGGHLAEALAFAHAKGVLHCDIKPGNILLTPYGRPMLADFNVAFNLARLGSRQAGLGGTVSYMAPEYLAAVREGRTGSVDERCDIYSLGVVLHELTTGAKPRPNPISSDTHGPMPQPEKTEDMLHPVPRELAVIIRRCLEWEPSRRYQTAAELASALCGAWHLLATHRALSRVGPVGRVGRWVIAHPIAALVLTGLIPHIPGSLVNIAYNAVQIKLTDSQLQTFESLVLVYNLIVYPACAGVFLVALRGISRRLPSLPWADGPAVDDLRRRVRVVGWMVIGLGCAGWFPGAVVFPLGIDLMAGPISWETYGHFAMSFILSGLIGVVFSFLGVVYLLFHSFLPNLGHPDTYQPGAIGAEIHPLVALLGPCLMLSCAVPLTGAALLVMLESEPQTLGFRLLVTGLIGLGMGGVLLAARVASRLFRLAKVWGEGEGEGHGVATGYDRTRMSGYVRSIPPGL
jgi:serine/threonine protein kinase